MDKEHTELEKYLKSDFNKLWNELINAIPELENLFNYKEIKKIGVKYSAKYVALCYAKQDSVTSSCLLDTLLSSKSNETIAKDFIDELNGIAIVVGTVLKNASSNPNKAVLTKIQQIIKEMVVTMDTDPNSTNSDYRNRLHELLVYNWLCDCENISVIEVASALGNNKDADFKCLHNNGDEFLVEVVSINNIDLSKQDDEETFSSFIGKKVQDKYDSKMKRASIKTHLFVLPIINYEEGLIDFLPNVDSKISFPPFTVVKNIDSNKTEILLMPIENLKTK